MRNKLAFLIIALFVYHAGLEALPKFASRLNLNCQSCHVNPTGGGMRNIFGATLYGRDELPVPTWQEDFALDDFTTELNSFISIGVDLRSVYYYQQDPLAPRSSFIHMQTDLYVSARLSRKSVLVLSKGIGDRFEAYGIANILPTKGFVKVGWFTPAFGIRMDDHNIFVREKTLFAFNGGQDAGIEAAFAPGPFLVLGSLTNGSTGMRDIDKFKALLGRVEFKQEFGQVGMRIGGSYYNNATSQGVATLMGGFTMVSVGKNLALLAEADWKKNYSNATLLTRTSFISFFEANYVLTQGIDLKLGYDFYDPDVDRKTGSQSRIVFGFEFFPIPGFELRPFYVIRNETPTDSQNNQFILMFHLYL